MIPLGVLNGLSRLVLTNAIYFKGEWAAPFPMGATQRAAFHVSDDREVLVPLMHRRVPCRYWEGNGLKALELTHGRGDLAMIVLLPDEIEGLAGLERRLNSEAMEGWISGMRRHEVDVALPRFSLNSQLTLNRALGALGMSRAFSQDEADFSGIDGSRDLYLAAAIHKAFVDVSEEGTEAAAATGAVLGVRSAAPSEPKVFRADHPFIFLIRDTRTGSILFLGRLTNPEI